MIRMFVIALIALSLTACFGRSVKDDSPANDLDALVLAVQVDAKPRLLPNGKLYCAELSKTDGAQDDCLGDLEDALSMAEGDKASMLRTVQRGVSRLKLQRNPCGFWEKLFRQSRCFVDPD